MRSGKKRVNITPWNVRQNRSVISSCHSQIREREVGEVSDGPTFHLKSDYWILTQSVIVELAEKVITYQLPEKISAQSITREIKCSDQINYSTKFQKSLCLNATSALEIAISDSDDELSPATQRKLCFCASQNPKQTQEAAQRTRLDSQNHSFPYHTHQITEDYTVSSEV